MMRASAAEYRSLHLRAHELLRDIPLYDVSYVDLSGGGSGRTGSGRRYLYVLHSKVRRISILDVTDPSQPAVLETRFWPEGAPVHFSRRLRRCRGSVQQLRSAPDGGACCAASLAS